MSSFLMFLYGIGSYLAFLMSFLYLIAFVGDLPVPRTIDSGMSGSLSEAVAVNLLVLSAFALQHSIMARPAFKRWWTRVVPQTIERSSYVLAASAALGLIIWQWRPLPQPLLWRVEDPVAILAIQVMFWTGWGVLLASSFMINHFDLFGLSQVYHRLAGSSPKTQEFRTPLLYRHVRHPLYLGFVIGAWSTPRMTLGHLLFAGGMTTYIFIGIYFEERDLVRQFGERYLRYRESVAMLLPWPKGKSLPNPRKMG
ncbi:MAG: methanethiol S-methyltransferase [Burkholderiaceae bacterium]